jgi:hypothetical protein
MSGIGPNPLNDISRVYLESIAEKKDDTYLEPDMKKRQKNNEKARKDMEKMGTSMKNPHFEEKQQGWDAVNSLAGAYEAMHQDTVDEEKKKLPYVKMYRKAGNLGRDGSPEAMERSKKITGVMNKNAERVAAHREKDDAAKEAKRLRKEALDPVGKEDGDVNNDGKKDGTDKYLLNRRKAIGNAIKKKMKKEEVEAVVEGDGDPCWDTHKQVGMKKKGGKMVPNCVPKTRTESFSSWRTDLSEVMTDDIDSKPIKEKSVKNKVTINPKLGESVEELGGEIVEMVEVDEFACIVEEVTQELIAEGFDPEYVIPAIEEATVTFGHDTKKMKDDGSQVGSKRRFLKRKAKSLMGKAAYKAYHAARDAKRAMTPAAQRMKTSVKRGIRNAALKVADKLKEENVDEAVYGGTPPEKKDTRMTVTAADKKANTPAYQKYKAGDKRYKAADHMNEVYKGKHGQSDKEYMDSRSDAGKQISGDSKMSGAAYSHRSFKGQGKPAKPGERQKAQGRMTPADRNELAIRKAALKKEEMSTQELALQKRKANLDQMIAKRRKQELGKGISPTKTMGEEASDAMKDRRMERGGVGGNQRYDRAPKAPNTNKFGTGKTALQKDMEKKYGKGASAMDIVKAEIRAKHGKGAIMDTKKK